MHNFIPREKIHQKQNPWSMVFRKPAWYVIVGSSWRWFWRVNPLGSPAVKIPIVFLLTQSSPNIFAHRWVSCVFLFQSPINSQSNYPNIFWKTLRRIVLVMLWILRSQDIQWTVDWEQRGSYLNRLHFSSNASLTMAKAKCAGSNDHPNGTGVFSHTETRWGTKTLFSYIFTLVFPASSPMRGTW